MFIFNLNFNNYSYTSNQISNLYLFRLRNFLIFVRRFFWCSFIFMSSNSCCWWNYSSNYAKSRFCFAVDCSTDRFNSFVFFNFTVGSYSDFISLLSSISCSIFSIRKSSSRVNNSFIFNVDSRVYYLFAVWIVA